jgi:hypothetical protein
MEFSLRGLVDAIDLTKCQEDLFGQVGHFKNITPNHDHQTDQNPNRAFSDNSRHRPSQQEEDRHRKNNPKLPGG